MAGPTGADLHVLSPLGVSRGSASAGKLTKAESNYRPGKPGDGLCGGCRFFRNGTCTKVQGRILASMTCDLYEPSSIRASETQTFRGVGGALTRGRGPGGKRTHAQSYYTGASAHGPSILNPAVYEALRDKKGMDKKSAAAISNAALNKKRKGGGWYRKGRHSSGKPVKMTEPTEQFFDKKAYMKAYNAKRGANPRGVPKKALTREGRVAVNRGRQMQKGNKVGGLFAKRNQGKLGHTKVREAVAKIRLQRQIESTTKAITSGRRSDIARADRDARKTGQARLRAYQSRAAGYSEGGTEVERFADIPLRGRTRRRAEAGTPGGRPAPSTGSTGTVNPFRKKRRKPPTVVGVKRESPSTGSRYSEPESFVEQLLRDGLLITEEFFDKKAYMKTYNQRRYAPKRRSEVGRRQAASGIGRLNRSKKITKSNPSAASTARIARYGMKRGVLSPGSTKNAMKNFVRGFARARKQNFGKRAAAAGHGPVPNINAKKYVVPRAYKKKTP